MKTVKKVQIVGIILTIIGVVGYFINPGIGAVGIIGFVTFVITRIAE
jgi:preprotein translocase subunit Sss1